MEISGLGKKINETRKARNLTAEQLSERCNINAVYLRQIEGGSKIPSLPVFVSLCNALTISPDYLLQDELDANELSIIPDLDKMWMQSSPSTHTLVCDIIQTVLSHFK